MYTAAQVDAEIAANGFNAADYFTRSQSDLRYFPNNANPGNAEVFTLVRDSVSIPRQMRGILPRAPLAWSYLFSGTITELRCDAYSKAEADGRCLSSTGYTGTLDGRYLVTNANAGSSEVFTLIRDANAVPRQLRGILRRALLGWSHGSLRVHIKLWGRKRSTSLQNDLFEHTTKVSVFLEGGKNAQLRSKTASSSTSFLVVTTW